MPAQSKKVSRGILENLAGFHLRLAQLKVFKDFEESMGDLNISPVGFAVMEVLNQNPGLTQSKLATAIFLDRSSVVPLLDKMENRGLLSRQASTTDRRNNHLFLSEEGQALLAKAMERVESHESKMAKLLNPDEYRQLITLLTKLSP